jgi:sugar phosphate isomerase/epimerase
MAMHERLSIHQICFSNLSLPEYVQRCRMLGAQRIGFISQALLTANGLSEARAALIGGDLKVQTVAHVFRTGHLSSDKAEWVESRDALNRLIDITAELGGRSIYMLTGGHGGLDWEDAAAIFCEAIAPCVEHASRAGIGLAIENASSLYADLHIAHSLSDTIRLAEMANIGVCIELFFCWVEAKLPHLFAQAMPRCQMVQLSDYICGDRSLPARAVPGDGSIPLERIVRTLLDTGYRGAFDLELLGPRIDAEGADIAVARAAANVSAMLDRLNA